MIKIISGKFKGRKLLDVPNLYVRPTQAVVRKSMMQILEPFDGASVLLESIVKYNDLGMHFGVLEAKQIKKTKKNDDPN